MPGTQASSGEDRLVHVWDLDQKRSLDTGPESKRPRVQLPQELMLTHAGHRAPVSTIPFPCHTPARSGYSLYYGMHCATLAYLQCLLGHLELFARVPAGQILIGEVCGAPI